MSKKKLYNATRGAVSVFLVIILVPCMLVASIFVDLGRVRLARANNTVAADLALDSLLTNYDYDLKEWYGLAASCQSIDEFYTVSEDYFRRTISSKGLSKDEVYTAFEYVESAFESDDIVDLLNADCLTDAGTMMSAVPDANLSNPTIMKKQVVEFMKYRAPIEITTQLIDRLKKDSSVGETLEAEKNEPIAEDKKEYYEKEGELLEVSYKIYQAIKKYSDKNMTNDKLQQYANKINGYRDVYKEITKKTISNLINTDGLSVYNRVQVNVNDYGYGSVGNKFNEKSGSLRSYSKKEDGVEKYYIKNKKISDLCDDLQNKINNFNTKHSEFETAGSSVASTLPSGDVNAVQWWVKANKAVNNGWGNPTSKLKTAAEDMMKAYSKVKALMQATNDGKLNLDEDVTDTEHWSDRPNMLINNTETIVGKYLKKPSSISSSSSTYLKIVSNLETVSYNNKDNIKPENITVNVNGASVSLNSAVSTVSSDIKSIKTELQEYINLIDDVLKGRHGIKKLDDLKKLVTEYQSKLNTWDTQVKSTDTEMATEHATEINDIKENNFAKDITPESVDKLKTRLENIRSQFQNMINDIDNIKFSGKKVMDISSFSTLKGKIKSVVSDDDIPMNQSDLNSFCETKFNEKMSSNYSSEALLVKLSHMSDNNYNVEINPVTGKVATPELYKYFYTKFNTVDDSKVEQHKKGKDKAKDKAKNAENEAKSKGRYPFTDTGTIAKEFSGDNTAGLGNSISSIVKLFSSLMNGKISDIRDDIYVTSYIMNMFSYATFEEQGKFSLIENNQDLMLHGNRVPAEYNSDEVKNKWASEKPTDPYNKTLTNKMINKKNNVAYDAEIEYILYGKTGDNANQENVKAAYSKIYLVRYPLNLVSGFASFWKLDTKNTTSVVFDTVANSIQAVTQGIIPAALVKVVLIALITALETCKDLDRLEAGFPVELYKKDYTKWWCALPSVSSVSSDDFDGAMGSFDSGSVGDKKAGNEGIYYSDYLTVFVYTGLGNNGVATDMLKRMAEVMQTNMKKQEGVPEDYSLTKSKVYFKLDAKMRVKPIMVSLPYFSGYDNDMNNSDDWCTYDISMVRGY